MALYETKCENGHYQEVFLPMSSVHLGMEYPPCETCQAPTKRVITKPNETGTENVFRPRWSHELSQNPDGSPVEIKNRVEWNRAMKASGLIPWEPGCDPRKERKKAEKERQEKRREERRKIIESAILGH